MQLVAARYQLWKTLQLDASRMQLWKTLQLHASRYQLWTSIKDRSPALYVPCLFGDLKIFIEIVLGSGLPSPANGCEGSGALFRFAAVTRPREVWDT